MPFHARYHALKDFPFTMGFFETKKDPKIPGSKDIHKLFELPFKPPGDIVLEDSGENMPYLSFRLDPSDDAKNLKLAVSIKNQTTFDIEIYSANLSGTNSRTINELIKGSLIRKGEVNKFKFEVLGATSGTIDVSDVIFWFIRSG